MKTTRIGRHEVPIPLLGATEKHFRGAMDAAQEAKAALVEPTEEKDRRWERTWKITALKDRLREKGLLGTTRDLLDDLDEVSEEIEAGSSRYRKSFDCVENPR